MSTGRNDKDKSNEDRPVKDIADPAKSVVGNVSAKRALDEMKSLEVKSALVIDEQGELLGSVSKDKINRKVGGLGHDPKTAPIEPQMEKDVTNCFEDQTIGEAKQIMLEAKVPEVAVVTREKRLVGTTNLEAIAQEKDRQDSESEEKSNS
jgi:CBS domain-containing protein